MARIRSVHPGMWTDENFVGLSADAQVLLIGLGTEADDFGLFEWKPITLRMRLRPTKDGPVEPFLQELESANWLRRYEINGRKLCAIRNFAKWQNPRFPKNTIPFTSEIGKYVGLTPDDAAKASVEEAPLQRFTETTVLMESSGEENKKPSDKSDPRVRSPKKFPEEFEQFWKAYPTDKLMSKAKAGAYWPKLSPEDRALAIAAIPGFREHCRKNPTYRAVHAVRFLSERRFEGFASAQSADPEAAAASRDRADQFLKRGKYAETVQ